MGAGVGELVGIDRVAALPVTTNSAPPPVASTVASLSKVAEPIVCPAERGVIVPIVTLVTPDTA